jgi:hypothetical protein
MVRICKNSLDLPQFPNFSKYPMFWQFWGKKKQRTLGVKVDMECAFLYSRFQVN